MSDINIDDLQREISAAESYLQRVPSGTFPSTDAGLRYSRETPAEGTVHMPRETNSSNNGIPERIGTDIMELNRILLRTQKEEIEKPPAPPIDYMNPSALSVSGGSERYHERDGVSSV